MIFSEAGQILLSCFYFVPGTHVHLDKQLFLFPGKGKSVGDTVI